MKKTCDCSCNKTQQTVMTVLRIALGAAMLFFGLSKLGALPEVINFLGGAAHGMGLTFLPVAVWGWMALIGEILAGVLLVFGCSKKIGSLLTLIIMLVAAGGAHGWTIAGGALKAYIFAAVALALLLIPGGMSLINVFTCKKSSCKIKKEVIEA